MNITVVAQWSFGRFLETRNSVSNNSLCPTEAPSTSDVGRCPLSAVGAPAPVAPAGPCPSRPGRFGRHWQGLGATSRGSAAHCTGFKFCAPIHMAAACQCSHGEDATGTATVAASLSGRLARGGIHCA